MIIYNPHNATLLKQRIKESEALLNQIPTRYCFITGSFLYKEKYKDIDIFIITRSKKEYTIKNRKAKITIIDFNDLYSLFYHSLSKSCIAKHMLPVKPLKVTMADYWSVINETVPTLMNNGRTFRKNARSAVLYTEYFSTGSILDTVELDQKMSCFKTVKHTLTYIKEKVPQAITKNRKKSYIKRLFYTYAHGYKNIKGYAAQDYLYKLAHIIIRGAFNG